MKQPARLLISSLTVALATLASKADVVTDWNKIALDATKTGGLNSNLASRINAIEAAAVYDAANSILQFGTPYHYNVPPAGPASAEAAVAQAAHDVLASVFPAQKAALDARLDAALATIPNEASKDAGRSVGAAAAADILALRADDGSTPNITYPGPATPGVGEWRPTPGPTAGSFPPGINAQWGSVRPFVLSAANQFRPSPPPAVGSDAYNQALAEVAPIGSSTSSSRTSEQTHIAQFYKQDAELTVNEAARQLATAHGLSLEENALLFALVDFAVADARIGIWEAKYTYRFWRPVTALNAAPDGSVTNGYATWLPLLVTPAHPSYPSGHSGTVNAGVRVLKDFFGNRQSLALHTTTAGEPERIVQSLSQIESENGLSRIYGGIHYSFDNLQGQEAGNKVAEFVLAHGPRLLRSSATQPPTLAARRVPGLSLQGPAGHTYRIDWSPNVQPAQWTTLRYVTTPSGNTPLRFFDLSDPSDPLRIYRAVEVSN